MSNRHGKEWITLKEASKITGKSVNAIRILINRGKIDNVKKMESNGRSYWLIRRDGILVKCLNEIPSDGACREPADDAGQMTTITLEYYDRQREKWEKEKDELKTGLMMYRYKFEEIERKIRLLPAPVEVVASRMEEVECRLQEEQVAREKLVMELEAERKKSWWKKLFHSK